MSTDFLNGMAEQKDQLKEHYVPNNAEDGNSLWTEKSAQCAVEQMYHIE